MANEPKTWRRGPKTPSAKKKSVQEAENTKIARFASVAPSLTLWREPIEEERIGERLRTKPGSGLYYEFDNGLFQTSDEDVILWFIDHLGFRVDFHPLPQVGDWWEAHEFFRKETTEILSPTKKERLRRSEVDEIIGKESKELAKTVETPETSVPEVVKRIG